MWDVTREGKVGVDVDVVSVAAVAAGPAGPAGPAGSFSGTGSGGSDVAALDAAAAVGCCDLAAVSRNAAEPDTCGEGQLRKRTLKKR